MTCRQFALTLFSMRSIQFPLLFLRCCIPWFEYSGNKFNCLEINWGKKRRFQTETSPAQFHPYTQSWWSSIVPRDVISEPETDYLGTHPRQHRIIGGTILNVYEGTIQSPDLKKMQHLWRDFKRSCTLTASIQPDRAWDDLQKIFSYPQILPELHFCT